ncbi:MAG: hypothetical protein KDB14_27140 [Planctomycetales bacterium]|nr:hypothetical protein [Planctomycetales bacterium]
MHAVRSLLPVAACLVAICPSPVAALTYDIHLYRPLEIAKKGIHATIRETQSGELECAISFDKGCVGSMRVTSVELSSKTDHAAIDLELRGRESDGALTCRFTLSRSLLMHGHVTIGVEDTIPGGTFYHVHFVDFVEFDEELPPALKRRQARLAALEIESKLPRYGDSTPARGEPADPSLLQPGKTRITPFNAPGE